MSQECPSPQRLSLGAYVLGLLGPGERREVEEHLAACTSCRDELAGLAGLPGLLARVPPDVVVGEEPATPGTRAGLHAAVTRARRSSRQRRHLANALVGCLAAGVSAAALLLTGDPPAPAPAAPTVVAAVDGRTDASLRLAVRPSAEGTALDMRMRGAPAGERCTLVAVTRDGRRETAARWRADYEGEADVRGRVTIPARELGSFEVVTASGRRLVGTSLP